jgi:exonuclease SbcC
MKILELRFKNLNSLYGEWCIDFTHPDYEANGLFAITGSTGSGKTTILDALCLALYGQTPRLGKMTQSDNEVMSRQTGDCFSEVLFETAKGIFRANWHQQRARKKTGGALQAPKREIVDEQGTVLATKLREVQEKVDDVMGMGFDRFTQSILLAQGSFDSFLKANADERSPILEQITGTEIYTEISKLVHQRNSTENQKLGELKAGLDGIQLLDDEALEQIQFDLKQVQDKHKEEARKRDAAKAALDALERIKILGDDLTNTKVKYPALEKNLTQAEDLHKKTVEQRTQAEAEYEKLRPILQQVRELDTQASERQTAQKKEEIALQKQRTDLKKLQAQKNDNEIKLSQLQTQQTEAEAYQKEHAQDAALVGQLAAILQTLEQIEHLSTQKSAAEKIAIKAIQTALKEKQNLTASEKKLATTETELSQIEGEQKTLLGGKTLPDWRTQFDSLNRRARLEQRLKETRANLTEKSAEAEASENELAKKLKEQRSLLREQDLLQKNLQLQQKIESLEAERDELVDGQPCPLCGALEHPYTVDLPAPQTHALDSISATLRVLTEQINRLTEKKSAAITLCGTLRQILEKDESELQSLAPGNAKEADVIAKRIETLEQLEKQQTDAKDALDHAREAVYKLNTAASKEKAKTAQAQQSEIETTLSKTQHRLQQKIEPYGVSLSMAATELRLRKERWMKAENQITELRQPLATLATTRINQTEQIEEYELRIQQQTETLNKAKLSIAKLQADRETLFGNQQPDAIETKHQTLLNQTKNATETTQTKFIQSQQAMVRLQEKITTLGKQLQGEREQKHIETSPEEHAALAERCDDLKEQSGNLKSRITTNEKAAALHVDKLGEIEKQQTENARWNMLHELIGSADGKKFRNFAQGLTFELMVSHANRQLAKMSDRYLLIRDQQQPLDLNVVDNYQAGEIRPVKNLSGGESFVVSLSLALGLSRMASKHIRVDSLFLDEGFGTLDEDALETALEALTELKQDGKLIGVISHVGALKERIGTQINVLTTSGGRSRLSGVGVLSKKEPNI